MAKFNTKQKSLTTKTVNRAGGEAFKESDKLAFVSLLLTSFVEDQFYRSKGDTLKELDQYIEKFPEFAAKAAIYARDNFGMRSITHATAAEIVRLVKGASWTKDFVANVVIRPDDMNNIVAAYMAKVGRRPLPNSLKKGLAIAFRKFDAYQIAKYKQADKDVSLVDLVNLVHPIPQDKNEVALSKLIRDELVSENTYEAKLSKAGQSENKEEAKAEAWRELLESGKIGYFALLRNLRNINDQAPDMIDRACELLTKENLILRSRVLPFRFYTATEALLPRSTDRRIVVAIQKAVDISLANVPKFEGKTLVVLDESGSMSGKPSEIGSLFAAALYKSNDADFMAFADYAQYGTFNPTDSVTTLARQMLSFNVGGGTNFHAIFNKIEKAYDRIIILSDMQGWVGYHAPTSDFAQYKKKFNCSPHIYSFDLQGQGTLQFPENQVYALAGFSDKIFDIMKLLETDKNALINTIEAISLEGTK